MSLPTINEPLVLRLPFSVLELYANAPHLCAVVMTPPGRAKSANQQMAFCSEDPRACRVNIALWLHSAPATSYVQCKLWMGGFMVNLNRAQAEQIAATFGPHGLVVEREAFDCREGKRGRTSDPEVLAQVAAPV